MTFLMLPAALALAVMGTPIVRLIFERGAFDGHTSTAMTAAAVAFYGSGLAFYGAIKVTAPVYFAFEDTRTPVRCAFAGMITNIGLNLAFMGPLRLGGLALATALSAGVNVALLLWFLRRRIGPFFAETFRPRALPFVGAGAVMVGVMLAAGRAMPRVADALGLGSGSFGAAAVGALVPLALGGVAYLAAAHLLGAPEVRSVAALVRRRG